MHHCFLKQTWGSMHAHCTIPMGARMLVLPWSACCTIPMCGICVAYVRRMSVVPYLCVACVWRMSVVPYICVAYVCCTIPMCGVCLLYHTYVWRACVEYLLYHTYVWRMSVVPYLCVAYVCRTIPICGVRVTSICCTIPMCQPTGVYDDSSAANIGTGNWLIIGGWVAAFIGFICT